MGCPTQCAKGGFGCWPDGDYVQPIQRTLVIGEGLWSYSPQRLQENALEGLARLQVVDL